MATQNEYDRDVADRQTNAINPNAPDAHDNTAGQVVGAGVGGTTGALTGAAIGTAIGGPIGAAIGAVAGVVVGAMSGKVIADANADDDEYWRDNYSTRPYVQTGDNYDTYAPAYRYGSTAAGKYPERKFEEVEHDLRAEYEKTPTAADLAYDRARGAIQDAYDRTLKLRSERLNVDKERVQTGEANVRKEVITEHQRIDVPVTREELVIERRAVAGDRSAAPIGEGVAAEGETIRIPLSEEQVNVSKEAVVKEEVSIGKRQVTETQRVGADVSHEQLRTEGTATRTTETITGATGMSRDNSVPATNEDDDLTKRTPSSGGI